MGVEESLIKKMVAEAIGTFILVFVGTGALMLTDNYVFAFGFALIAIVYAIGHISGAHVNPAVTLGLTLTGRFPMFQVPYYWGGQIIGALLASLLLRLLYGNLENLGTTQIGDGYSVVDGFVLELVMTAILVFVVHAVATDERSSAASTGLAIGGTLLFIQIAAGTVSGGSVNPARSLAPAIVSGTLGDLWIYVIAPFIGAIIGAIAYEFIGGADATQIPAQVGTTADSQRSQRRGGRGRPGDNWERPINERRPSRPKGAERDRQKREKRPDRQQREHWQQGEQRTEQRTGQRAELHDDEDFEQDLEQPPEQSRVREPRGGRGPQASPVEQEDLEFQDPPDFDLEDAPPQRRPQRPRRPEQSPDQRPGQRRRRLPAEEPPE